MNILYVASKYHDGRPEMGLSHEQCNFFDTLRRLGFNIVHFDPLVLGQKYGRRRANALLLEVEKSHNFDLMFTCLYIDQLDFKTVERITERGNCITYNWFCDDRWRFNSYSCLWAPCFRWVSTTDASALPRYKAIGYESVIKTQWAYNQFDHVKEDLPLKYDVSFVGQKYGDREAIIDALRREGVRVNVWGGGWPDGKVSQEEMNRIFTQSRINLNPSKVFGQLAAAVSTPENRKKIDTHFQQREIEETLRRRLPSKMRRVINGGFRVARAVTKSSGAAARYYPAAADPSAAPLTDIKARTFEVPSRGGFLLTGYAPGLEEYYQPNKEIVSYVEDREIVDLVKFYLAHEEQRQQIASAGYCRTITDHTYVHRFSHIFSTMGLPFPDLEMALSGRMAIGEFSEIQ
jgi:spore maturation protein CgeB